MKTLQEQITQQGADTNVDDVTLNQISEIENEIKQNQPLVTETIPISSVEDEYKQSNSQVFAQKAKDLATRYNFIRKVRGDGNCFYRALAFAQCERLRSNRAEYDKFLKLTSHWKENLIKLGFPKMTTEDFCDTFLDILAHLNDDKEDNALLNTFRDEGLSNYVVVFMRIVTSGYLQENEKDFADFIEGERTVREYCSHEVEPMNKECDHLCITALTKALGIPLRIEYMDQTLAPSQGWHHDFLPEDLDVPSIFFLYRPGHYDILYPK